MFKVGIMEFFSWDGLEMFVVEEDNLITEVLANWRIWVEKMMTESFFASRIKFLNSKAATGSKEVRGSSKRRTGG